jgi:hypothetical protein
MAEVLPKGHVLAALLNELFSQAKKAQQQEEVMNARESPGVPMEVGAEENADAHKSQQDPRRRIRDLLFSADPMAPLPDLVKAARPARRFTGPGPWLEVLTGR